MWILISTSLAHESIGIRLTLLFFLLLWLLDAYPWNITPNYTHHMWCGCLENAGKNILNLISLTRNSHDGLHYVGNRAEAKKFFKGGPSTVSSIYGHRKYFFSFFIFRFSRQICNIESNPGLFFLTILVFRIVIWAAYWFSSFSQVGRIRSYTHISHFNCLEAWPKN